jgi:hypothetical protein
MPRRLKHRLWASDGDPGLIAWTIASVSLVLPVIGLGLVLYGGGQAIRGEAGGWHWLGLGAALLVLDIVIDFIWAHPGVSESDQPHLNQRGQQLAGRIVVVAEAIEGGRGKVRVGDTLWAAEGPESPPGAEVRIVAANASVLVVEAAEGGLRAEPPRS